MKSIILLFLLTSSTLLHSQIYEYSSSLNGLYNNLFCMSPDQSQKIILTSGTSKDWLIQLKWTNCEGEESMYSVAKELDDKHRYSVYDSYGNFAFEMNFVQSYGKFGINIYSFHDEMIDISKFTPEKLIDLNKLNLLGEYSDDFSEVNAETSFEEENTLNEEVNWSDSASDEVFNYLVEIDWYSDPGLSCYLSGTDKKMKILIEGKDYSGVLLKLKNNEEIAVGYFIGNSEDPSKNALFSERGFLLGFERGGIKVSPNWSWIIIEDVKYESSCE